MSTRGKQVIAVNEHFGANGHLGIMAIGTGKHWGKMSI